MNAHEFLNLFFENKPEGSQVQIVELPSKKAVNFDSIEEAAKGRFRGDPSRIRQIRWSRRGTCELSTAPLRLSPG